MSKCYGLCSAVARHESTFGLLRMSFYLIDDLEQGSSDWLLWRMGVVGASDAPTIMGENPWASPNRLLEEKLGLHRAFGGNEATREGHRLEDVARQLLIKKLKTQFRPSIIQDSKEPFLAASLDAIDDSSSVIIEIKCGAKSYQLTRDNSAVPNYYYAQLQHMMMVSQLETILFAAYRPEEPLITLEIKRNDSYIKRMRKAEKDFIQLLSKRGHKAQNKFVGRRVS